MTRKWTKKEETTVKRLAAENSDGAALMMSLTSHGVDRTPLAVVERLRSIMPNSSGELQRSLRKLSSPPKTVAAVTAARPRRDRLQRLVRHLGEAVALGRLTADAALAELVEAAS